MTEFGREIERWEHAKQEIEKKGLDPERLVEKDPDRYKALIQPEPPEGFSYRDIWFDLSPMRPDEFGRQVAARWEQAEKIQAAFNKGKKLEKAVRQHAADSEARSNDAIERLKQKM